MPEVTPTPRYHPGPGPAAEGKWRPGTVPTNEQQSEIIELTQELMARGLNTGDIKRALRKTYGAEMSRQTCLRYMVRARNAFRKDAGRHALEIQSLRAEQVRLCRSILADPKARPHEKIRASERIAALLGLDAPVRHDVAVTDKTPRKPIGIDFGKVEQERREAFGLPEPENN